MGCLLFRPQPPPRLAPLELLFLPLGLHVQLPLQQHAFLGLAVQTVEHRRLGRELRLLAARGLQERKDAARRLRARDVAAQRGPLEPLPAVDGARRRGQGGERARRPGQVRRRLVRLARRGGVRARGDEHLHDTWIAPHRRVVQGRPALLIARVDPRFINS